MITSIIIPADPGTVTVISVITIAFAIYGAYSFAKNMRPRTIIPDIKRWIAARTQSDDQYD
jgi:hypothetical protein